MNEYLLEIMTDEDYEWYKSNHKKINKKIYDCDFYGECNEGNFKEEQK